MPIEFKEQGDVCKKCKKPNTEVGPITYYTDPHDGYKGLLCSECIKRREKSYTEKCPKCKRIAYEHGGLTYYDDSDADDLDDEISDNYDSFDDFDYGEKPPSFESMCMECHKKKVARVRKIRKVKLTIKNFAKNHWKFWISTGLVIIGLVMAYFSFFLI